MVRFLTLISIGIILAYLDMRFLFGFMVALAYCVACNMIDDRNDRGDC